MNTNDSRAPGQFGLSRERGLSNNPIKQPVHPVTRFASAKRPPVWPAAYRVRWTV